MRAKIISSIIFGLLSTPLISEEEFYQFDIKLTSSAYVFSFSSAEMTEFKIELDGIEIFNHTGKRTDYLLDFKNPVLSYTGYKDLVVFIGEDENTYQLSGSYFEKIKAESEAEIVFLKEDTNPVIYSRYALIDSELSYFPIGVDSDVNYCIEIDAFQPLEGKYSLNLVIDQAVYPLTFNSDFQGSLKEVPQNEGLFDCFYQLNYEGVINFQIEFKSSIQFKEILGEKGYYLIKTAMEEIR